MDQTSPSGGRRGGGWLGIRGGRVDGKVIRTMRGCAGSGRGFRPPLAQRIEIGLFTALPGADIFDAADVVLMERRPIRSGRQVLRFVTDRKPTYAGIDPYNFYVDRNSADNVMAVK